MVVMGGDGGDGGGGLCSVVLGGRERGGSVAAGFSQAADHVVDSAFEKHDEDKNDKLFKKEYVKALERLRSGEV